MNQLSPDEFAPEGITIGPSISAADGGASTHQQSQPNVRPQATQTSKELAKLWDDFWNHWAKNFVTQDFIKPEPKDLKFYQNLLFAIHNASNRTGISTDFGMVYESHDGGTVRSRPGYHAIFSSDGKPKKGLLSDHEVLVAAFAASMDVKILRKGVKLSGTPEQMAQLQRGIEAVNEILPEGQKLVITNPVDVKVLAKFKPLDASMFVAKHGVVDQPTPIVTSNAPNPQSSPQPNPSAIITPVYNIDPNAKPYPDNIEPKESNSSKKATRSEEQIIFSALNDILKDQSESKLRNANRLFKKDGANTGHNVYQLTQTARLPGGETANLTAFYIVKNGKSVIATLTKNDEVVFRHSDIYMKNDIHHPKHPTFSKTATAEAPIVTVSIDTPITVAVSEITYGNDLASKFAPAVDHAAKVAQSSARAAAAVDRSKGPAPIGPA